MKKQKTNGNFWIYGHHAVTAALLNPNREKLFLKMTKEAALDKTLTKNVPCQIATRSEIEALLPPGAVHQGLALQVKPLSALCVDDLLEQIQNQDKIVILMLDQVTDPHNIGAILRSAAAFEAAAVILPDANAPEESGTLAKSACGGLEIVPLIRVPNLVRAIETLKKVGFWVIGLDGSAKKTMAQDKLPAKTVFILGSEGDGLRRLTAENCDYMLKLPISDKMESLNVSNAAAIALYEFNR